MERGVKRKNTDTEPTYGQGSENVAKISRSSCEDKLYLLNQSHHPYGIKPWGNYYIDQIKGIKGIRHSGLGIFACFDDETIVLILSFISVKELIMLSSVSPSFYVFSNENDLWRNVCLSNFGGDFQFQTTWKDTFVHKICTVKNRQIVPIVPIPISGFYSDYLLQSWLAISSDFSFWIKRDNIDRVSNISLEDFIEKYEKPNKPVIITDVVGDWPAYPHNSHNLHQERAWSKPNLLQRYRDSKFKCGRSEMTLSSYFQYASHVKEETPMYLFDNEYGSKYPDLLDDYTVPLYFTRDLFEQLPHRPSYRWILIGPPRSGSTFHKDPNSTSAWNGLLVGQKKWILYPPNLPPPGIHPTADEFDVICPISVMEWFMKFYDKHDKLMRRYETNPKSFPKKEGVFGMGDVVECNMKAGELLFIPNGWYHSALNVEESIAVTQNYVSESNAKNAVAFAKKKEKTRLYEELKQTFPDLVDRCEKELAEEIKKKLEKKTGLLGQLFTEASSTFGSNENNQPVSVLSFVQQ